jgi:LmbE family N-acetylglucosaminyl deacetylase
MTQKYPSNYQVVIFQPHNDDAVIAIGGIMRKLIHSGWYIHYVYITDSRFGGNEFPELVAATRNREAARERKLLGIHTYNELNYPDLSLSELSSDERSQAVSQISHLLDQVAPSVVFIPTRADLHPDHREVHDLVLEALQQTAVSPLLAKYAVWLFPDFYQKPSDCATQVILVGIDKEERYKTSLIRIHTSQIARRRYDLATRYLNRYYARMLKADQKLQVQSAEIVGLFYNEFHRSIKDNLLKSLMPTMDITTILHGQNS